MGTTNSITSLITRKTVAIATTFSLSVGGLAFIAKQEGTANTVYKDVVNISTVCTGHVTTLPVGTYVSNTVCEDLLKQDTKIAGDAVKRLVKVPITQEQYDAMVSLTFNIGVGNFSKSTLLRRVNEKNCYSAANEFTRWNKAKGVVYKGLTRRREAERQMFLSGCPYWVSQ